MENKVVVIGHKSPDTDTICSAIACAYLYEKKGYSTQAVRAGEINKETEFALSYFNVECPPLLDAFEPGEKVVLVDHNESKQTIDGVKEADVIGLIDHHRLGDFETEKPTFILIEPVGCTATILLSLFEENKISIPADIAGLMLSAIISDTLLFRSPTCTERDKEAVKRLAEMAGIDYEKYGMEMLKAGADISDMKPEEMVQNDKKEFTATAGEKVFSVAQLSVMDVAPILEIKETLLELMDNEREKTGHVAAFMMVTDILNESTDLLFVGDVADITERAFNQSPVGNAVHLPGVMSRKKQIIPPLLDVF